MIQEETSKNPLSEVLTPADEVSKPATAPMQKGDEILLSLREYYDTHPDASLIVSIIRDSSPVSLRLIDWFVTNYAKHTNVAYVVNQKQVIVYWHYKQQLKAYSKRLFDPFCRRARIPGGFTFKTLGVTLETTVGQLNFFRWAYNNRILQYAIDHSDAIEADMNSGPRMVYAAAAAAPTGETSEAVAPARTRKKRQELSQATAKFVTVYENMKVTLDFS